MDSKMVQAENERLLALFDGVDENQLDLIKERIHQLAWYNVHIRELQAKIDKDGVTIPYQNGRNQSGFQNNPDLKALVDMQKLVNPITKDLLPLVPEKHVRGKLDAWQQEFDDIFDCDDHSDLPLDLENV